MQRIPPIEALWKQSGFKPNESQANAIRHVDGPLFLTAGPGSGKTSVLLWRTLNLIVYHGVKPEEIFLSTFTEKAALQLREGLKSLLAVVTNKTGQPFDLGKMALGTVHSICRQILCDWRFSPQSKRPRAPYLLDELGQYFHLYDPKTWREIIKVAGFESVEAANREINAYLEERDSLSRHSAVTNSIALFNRFSEECLIPSEAKKKTRDARIRQLLDMYEHYRRDLSQSNGPFGAVDFSLLQQRALDLLNLNAAAESVYKYLIIDEYQDTNFVQEQLFFKLAKGSKNICVVGDDDQALYRFRGATVENLVEFEKRCKQYLSIKPTRIDLDTNYRSREPIVSFYTDFIGRCDWKKKDAKGYHRLHDKQIKPFRKEKKPCVIASSPGRPAQVYSEIVSLVKNLIRKRKVEDPNQIAFLFPSLKNNTKVKELKEALEGAGLKVYAPRAGKFLELPEAKAVLGLFMLIFGKPSSRRAVSQGLKAFHFWMKECTDLAAELAEKDRQLGQFIDDKHVELERIADDHRKLMKLVTNNRWSLDMEFPSGMLAQLVATSGLSTEARKTLTSPYLTRVIEQRKLAGSPYSLKYVLNRVTSLDWNILDLFYQLNGFAYFKSAYDAAEKRKDEGPLCNLGIISQYLSRFMEQFASVITASYLEGEKFQKQFFLSYIYALYRRQESEFEDADDPFPKGRIPFLTIHQAKGLEFPVVVLGSPRKKEWPVSQVEIIARKLTGRGEEPLDRIAEFDNMRMFYVSLSRPKNLLVIPHYKGSGQHTSPPFDEMLKEEITRIPDFNVDTLPAADKDKHQLGKTYSYTGDYLVYKKCPRQYMVFKKYGFVPSRSQTMFFGTLVHQTIEDLHHLFMQRRP
jgi:DNA helicase-2/ATP-dependent DNA helicase PcrA